MSTSKPLGIADESGFEFVKEILKGDPTFAINFDRVQKHPEDGYILFEFLLCEESQPYVTPYSSHPNKYWSKNSKKFISLFNIAKDLNATLYLVNYAKAGTKHADEIRIIQMVEIDVKDGITKENEKKMTRSEFSDWFRKLNKECSN